MLLPVIALVAQVSWQAVREGRTPDSIPFTQILDVTTDAAGQRAYIYDAALKQIRIVDIAGEQVGAFGRGGQGPGEFGQVFRLGWYADTLWVMDPPHRVHYFSRDGKLHRTFATTNVTLGATVVGGTLVKERVAPLPGVTQSEGIATTMRFIIAHHTNPGVRKVADLYEFVRPIMVQAVVGGQRATMYRAQPLRDDPLFLPDRDGRHLFIVYRRAVRDAPHTFQVIKLTLEGDTVFSRRYPYHPRPLDTKAFEAEVRGLQQTILTQQPGRRTLVEIKDLEKEVYRPFHWPAVEQAVIGRDGSIWLKRETGIRTAAYLVLSAAGEPAGRVELPAGDRLVEADGQRVWTIAKDAEDVPFVAWYRLRR